MWLVIRLRMGKCVFCVLCVLCAFSYHKSKLFLHVCFMCSMCFLPLVYQHFFIKNYIWLVIRQRMSKCFFWCFFLHSNFLNWFVFHVFFVFFYQVLLTSLAMCFLCFMCFLFFFFKLLSRPFSPCVFMMFLFFPIINFFFLQKFHFCYAYTMR